jgi:hypothetical protein
VYRRRIPPWIDALVSGAPGAYTCLLESVRKFPANAFPRQTVRRRQFFISTGAARTLTMQLDLTSTPQAR